MSAAENKQLMQQVFAELAKENGKPFVDLMADDFRWTITGTTPSPVDTPTRQSASLLKTITS